MSDREPSGNQEHAKWNQKLGTTIDRRSLLKKSAAGATALPVMGGILKGAEILDGRYINAADQIRTHQENQGLPPNQLPVITSEEAPPSNIEFREDLKPTPDIFKSEEVNSIIKDTDFSIKDFIGLSPTVKDSLHSHLDMEDPFFDIYPQEITEHKDEIERVADKYSLPVNLVSTLISFELNGQTGDTVDVENFVDNYRGILRYVAPELEPTLSELSPDPSNNANVIIATLGKIRAEANGESELFDLQNIHNPDSLPFKTRLYMSKVAKLFITLDLAHKLHNDYHFDNKEIKNALVKSDEIDARAWAIQQTIVGPLELPTESQEAFFEFIAQESLPETGKNAKEQAVLDAYRDYRSGNTDVRFKLDLTPAFRFDSAVNYERYKPGSLNNSSTKPSA